MGSSSDLGIGDDRPRRFLTTRWSMVASAANGESESSRRALEQLCEAYWYPIYAFARRKGNSPEAAADLAQSFFLQLLSGETLEAADPQRGRFRTFLLTAFQNHCHNVHRADQAVKRGGRVQTLSIDVDEGESRYGREPATGITPEDCFEQQWALTVLDLVYQRLAEEFREAGRGALFEAVKGRLTGADEGLTYREIAEQLGMMETGVKVAVHRMRNRFRELLRDEIRQTLDRESDVDDELRRLFSTFRAD